MNSIIYCAQPNKIVPYLINDLRKLHKKSEEISIEFYKNNSFSQIYTDKGSKFLSLNEILNNFIPFKDKIDINSLKLCKKSTFLSGLMNSDNILEDNEHFMFSFISHPVQRVYKMYYFIKNIYNKKTVLLVDKKIIEFFAPNFNTLTLEEYIDVFIDKKGLIKTNNILVCNNLFRQFLDINKLNFIGICEYLELSIEKLNRQLKINLNVDKYKKIDDSNFYMSYRIDDLTKLLEKDIFYYNIAVKNLLNS